MILIISHQERILNVADRIILLSDGMVSAEGGKDEIMPKLMGMEAACSALTQKAE